MKGLLLKDFYMILKYCRIYLIMIPISWGIMLFVKEPFFALYPCLLFCTIPITLQNYDEKEKWNSYSRTLPYSSKQLVSAKYLLNLLTVLLNLAMTLIGRLIQILVTPEVNPEELGTTLFFTFLISVIPTMLIMPVIFKFGAEKAMLSYGIMAIIIGLVCTGFATMGDILSFPEIAINPALLTGFILTGIVILYGISWLISIKVYSRKEFH